MLYLDSTKQLQYLAQRIFNYAGKTFRITSAESVEINSHWESGSRTYFASVNSDGSYKLYGQSGSPFDAQENPIISITKDCIVIKHIIFCGKDLGIEFIVHPSMMPKLLPSNDLTWAEKVVLCATRSLKSSYAGDNNFRLHGAMGQTGITTAEWNNAVEDLKEKKLLNKAGAITNDGRNLIGSISLYQLKKESNK